MTGKLDGEGDVILTADGDHAVGVSDLEIVRRAARLGFDPLRVAAALGVDLARTGQVGRPPAPDGFDG